MLTKRINIPLFWAPMTEQAEWELCWKSPGWSTSNTMCIRDRKYAKAGASEKEIRALADEAREQLLRYSQDELVAEAKAKGGLKLITIVWCSWELVLLEEVL